MFIIYKKNQYMLSLSPRFDLFSFKIPKDWFPDEVLEKYRKILSKDNAVSCDPVDYINESIQGITLSGLSELVSVQPQTSLNPINRGLGKINREPHQENSYKSTSNPLTNSERQITVTMRQNQGLYNYFMMYESIFWHICKHTDFSRGEDMFEVFILDEMGSPSSVIKLFQPLVSSIDGLEFTFNKTERNVETFNVTFNFNNLDYDFLPE